MLSGNPYKMRLRSRASNVNLESSSTAPSLTDSRPVLGDVSNRTHPNKEPTGKETAKSKAQKRIISESTQIDSSKEREDPALYNDAGQDENDVGGELRRSTRLRNNTRTDTRVKRKNTSPLQDEKIRKSKLTTRSVSVESSVVGTHLPPSKRRAIVAMEEREEVPPQAQSNSLVLEPFRLQRRSFDGKNHTLGIAPHDREETGDVLQVTGYVSDLFQHLYAAETTSHPRMYMANQRDINSKMRAILVDWLIEVHMKFRLVPDTLYLSINIIDRYCDIVKVQRNKLQLVGVTALLIACKYEEIYPPEVRDCVFITDRAYRREEVLAMEQDILGRLNYRISVPTAYPFVQRFLSLAKASPLTRHAANYYMERTLQEHDLLRFRPSLLSAASVILALSNPDIPIRENTARREIKTVVRLLLDFTGFRINDIITCAVLIAQKIGESPVTASRRQLVSVKRKYDSRRYLHVSASVELPDASYIPQMEGERE